MSESRAADHNLRRAARRPQIFDNLIDLNHRRCHERAQPDDIRVVFEGSANNFFRVNVLAEVNEFEAAVGKQRADNIFAQVVDVALDRGNDKSSLRLGLPGRENFFELVEGKAHGLGREEHLREKNFSRAEVFAEFVHGGGERAFGNFVGVKFFVDGSFNQRGNFILIALANRKLNRTQRVERNFFRWRSGGGHLRELAEVQTVRVVGEERGG